MKNLFKLSASAVIAATFTLCLADQASAQRREERRGGETRRTDRGDNGRNDGRTNRRDDGRGNGGYNNGNSGNTYGRNDGRNNGGYNNGGNNGYSTRRYDRWNRSEGVRRGNRWHYDNGITIRSYRYRYDLHPSLTWDYYFRTSGGRYLGATSLTAYTTDFDTVFTGDCGFRGLQLRVTGNHANIDHLVVHLDNGEIDYIDVNAYLANGAWTPWLDLSGWHSRCVRSVTVVGQTINAGAYGYPYGYPYGYTYQAQVEIYGRY